MTTANKILLADELIKICEKSGHSDIDTVIAIIKKVEEYLCCSDCGKFIAKQIRKDCLEKRR